MYEAEDPEPCWEIVSPSDVRIYTCNISPRNHSNVSWLRKMTRNMPKWTGKTLEQQTTDNWVKWVGEEALPREEHTKWLSSAKWSSLKINTSGLNELYVGVYMYITYIYACKNIWWKRPQIWRRVVKGIWEGLEGERERKKEKCN